jgi:glycosyltransferase involved in cell wall biosynthesis
VQQPGLVSIGVPVYNAAHILGRALDSMLSQTHRDFEILISDNASTDGTWELCQRYAAADPRVKLHRWPQNQGIFPNFRKVLQMASGEMFVWCGADDAWEPEFLQVLATELANDPGAGAAMCACNILVYRDGDYVPRRVLSEYDPAAIEASVGDWKSTAAAVCSRVKMNYFVCGLFRRRWLELVWREKYANSPAAERAPLLTLSLFARYVFVNRPLFLRTVYDEVDGKQRHPDIRYDSHWRGLQVSNLAYLYNLLMSAWSCEMVPLSRKLQVPGLLRRHYLFGAALSEVKQIVKSMIPFKRQLKALMPWRR